MSSTQAIRFGVIQGSILGPLLFVLYIDDLLQCLENYSINMSANDTAVCFTNLCTSEIAGVVKDDLYNGWKVAGLSLIRVKQNQCSLEVGRILANHQIFVYSYTEKL